MPNFRTGPLSSKLRAAGVALTLIAGTSASAINPVQAFASDCGGTAYAPPGTVSGPVSKSNTAVAGHVSNPPYRVHYSWEVQGNVPAPIAIQAKGWDEQGREKWIGMGATQDKGSGSVPWGNALGYPAIRATSASVTGATVRWSC